MRIYVLAVDDPVFITPFLRPVIEAIPSEIIGVGLSPMGSRLATRNQDRWAYALALVMLSSPWALLKRGVKVMAHAACGWWRGDPQRNPLSLAWVAHRHGIPVSWVADVNAPAFLEELRARRPDVVIAQSHAILGTRFLKIPAIGTLNRHGALLPKYRGRLAPFWAYLAGERECGVSIHFVQRALDAGPIVVQKRFPIGRFDTVDSLIAKVFRHAPEAMLEALDILRSGDYESRLLPNDDAKATYFSSPTLRDALRYRLVMLRRILLGQ